MRRVGRFSGFAVLEGAELVLFALTSTTATGPSAEGLLVSKGRLT